MADTVGLEQTAIGGSEIMEVMMTGGDGTEMNEDTLAQVVNMLQMEGQLTGGNQTIIIRQPGSNEIQMIQATSNGEEVIVSKASEADIQALQAANGVLAHVSPELLDGHEGQVVMMDEGGNLIEGVVQMQDAMPEIEEQEENIFHGKINEMVHGAAVGGFTNLSNLRPQNYVAASSYNSNVEKPISISTTTTTNKIKNRLPTHNMSNGEVVSIKINTGIKPKNVVTAPKNVIRISTVTGQQKYQPPKFHKCEACSINFVSKVAYINHMENCPSKKKPASPLMNKASITYTCVFCETKFTSRLILMQHVRTCDKAKSSKSFAGPQSRPSKLKVATSETKLGNLGSKSAMIKSGPLSKKGISALKGEDKVKSLLGKKKDAEGDSPRKRHYESESEEEKDIPYDDDEDLNEEDFDDEENLEETLVAKRSQKHLGPIIHQGMFKCRDCSRTFSKEYQYNRHVKGCTNAPLNASRIVRDSPPSVTSVGVNDVATLMSADKRKRMKINENETTSVKKVGGSKVVSYDPKKMLKILKYSDDESDEEIMDYLSGSSKLKSNMNKIVKISPNDKIVKQSGKVLLSKLNQEKVIPRIPLCGLCGDKFKNNADLIDHTKISHSEELLNLRDIFDGKGSISSLKCPLCDMHFLSTDSLLCHIITIHERELKSIQDELEIQNLSLCCAFCSTLCPSQSLLKEHIASKHLDKLISKPTVSNVLPIPDDISIYLSQNSTLGSKLQTKQEQIRCPDCSLVFMKSYFEHHKCASVNHSPSDRKYFCSESQCADVAFYKLIHLLTHLQQMHEKNIPYESHNFLTSSQFLDWLKAEENEAKMKYTKAFQRIKEGKLSSIWICHRFHADLKDASATADDDSKNIDTQNRCYSRIHAETSFSEATSRYDGKTEIHYYKTHKHPFEASSSPVENSQLLRKIREVVPFPVPIPQEPTTVTEALKADDVNPTAFSNAAELQKLLDEVDFTAKDKNTVNSFEPVTKRMPIEEEIFTSKTVQKLGNLEDKLEQTEPYSSIELPGNNSLVNEKVTNTKEDSGPISLSELFLEKMLAGPDADKEAFLDSTESLTHPTTVAKLTDVDMLAAFGENCLTPEDNSSTSVSSHQLPQTVKENSQEELKLDSAEDGEDDTDGEEESTYVLPADIEEWEKLFELVSSQLATDSICREEVDEAKVLLMYKDKILSIPIEKQVEVFNRLCSIANVQMT